MSRLDDLLIKYAQSLEAHRRNTKDYRISQLYHQKIAKIKQEVYKLHQYNESISYARTPRASVLIQVSILEDILTIEIPVSAFSKQTLDKIEKDSEAYRKHRLHQLYG